MPGFNSDIRDRSPSDDGEEIYGRRFDLFLDLYLATSPAPSWDPADEPVTETADQEVSAKETPSEPAHGTGAVDCLQNTTERLHRIEHMNNSDNVDIVPPSARKLRKKTKKPKTQASVQETDTYTRPASPAVGITSVPAPGVTQVRTLLNRNGRGTPIPHKELGYTTKGPVIDERAILAEKADRDYDKTCHIMRSCSLAATIKGRQKAIFNKLDTPLPPVGNTITNKYRYPGGIPKPGATHGRQMCLNVPGNSYVADITVSPNRIQLNSEPASDQSCKEIEFGKSPSPIHDKATSPFVSSDDYPVVAEDITTSGLPLSKMLSISDDIGSNTKRSTRGKAGLQITDQANTHADGVMSNKEFVVKNINKPADVLERHKRRSPLSMLKSAHNAMANSSEKRNGPSTSASTDDDYDLINFSNKEHGDFFADSHICKWKGMYVEEKAKVNITSPRKSNTRDSMWYTNRCYKEDATTYFFNKDLKTLGPDSRANCSRVEASLGYTEPVRGVVCKTSETSIHSDEELSPLPELRNSLKPSADQYAASGSHSVPRLKLEIRAELSDENACEHKAENTKEANRLMDTANRDTRVQLRAEMDTKVLAGIDDTLSSKTCIPGDTPQKKSRHRKVKRRKKSKSPVKEDDYKDNEQLENIPIVADKVHLSRVDPKKNNMSKHTKQPIMDKNNVSGAQQGNNTPNEANVEEIPESETGMQKRVKSNKIGMDIFKKSEKRNTADGASKRDRKPTKKGLMKIFKSSTSKITKGKDEVASSKHHKGTSSEKDKRQANAGHQQKGGVLKYLRSSWIGRKLFKTKSEMKEQNIHDNEDGVNSPNVASGPESHTRKPELNKNEE